jgi:glucokinase
MSRRFVVISGLPGSGKSTLGQQLAHELALPLIDKDVVLERLFDSHGPVTVARRRELSRESDRLFRAEAESSSGAVLVSHWRISGMSPASGTPTDWLPDLGRRLVHLHCVCPVEIAARRFATRARHPSHLDGIKSFATLLEELEALARLGPPAAGNRRLDVDTSAQPDLDELVEVLQRL